MAASPSSSVSALTTLTEPHAVPNTISSANEDASADWTTTGQDDEANSLETVAAVAAAAAEALHDAKQHAEAVAAAAEAAVLFTPSSHLHAHAPPPPGIDEETLGPSISSVIASIGANSDAGPSSLAAARDADKTVPAAVGSHSEQAEWRKVIEARVASMNKDSRHVATTQKRFLGEGIELSKPALSCDACQRNNLPCFLAPPHIKCCSCTLKGETCSFGLVRHSRKRKAHAERDSVLRQARSEYIGKLRALHSDLVHEARSRGANDVAELVESKLGACIAEMTEDMEAWVPKDPVIFVKRVKLTPTSSQ
ncbi:hypothetical protein V8E36_009976 [Tilletia maclaganii]